MDAVLNDAAHWRDEVPAEAQVEQDRLLTESFARDEPKLRRFIRSRVLSTEDAEDVLQDVFYELIQTYRLMKPVEQVTAWMYRVARNRVTDLFRRRRTESLQEPVSDQEGAAVLEDLLPSAEAGPEVLYARKVMLRALDAALEELPRSQREVFVAHEFEGKSFKQMADETGLSVNTLLARKRYAVLHLRRRMLEIDESFGR